MRLWMAECQNAKERCSSRFLKFPDEKITKLKISSHAHPPPQSSVQPSLFALSSAFRQVVPAASSRGVDLSVIISADEDPGRPHARTVPPRASEVSLTEALSRGKRARGSPRPNQCAVPESRPPAPFNALALPSPWPASPSRACPAAQRCGSALRRATQCRGASNRRRPYRSPWPSLACR